MRLTDKNIWTIMISVIAILIVSMLIKKPHLSSKEVLAAPVGAVTLEEPLANINVNLIEALKLRKSTREFTNNRISPKELSTILWAANGINRSDGKRTAPAAYGKYFIDIYVAADKGVYQYEPVKHQLKPVSGQNTKSKVAGQKFVGTASHVLIITANLNEFPFFVKNDERIACANATAGCIGENVYLVTNALNLGTCLMSSIDRNFIRESLNLKEDQLPLLIMPIGFPK